MFKKFFAAVLALILAVPTTVLAASELSAITIAHTDGMFQITNVYAHQQGLTLTIDMDNVEVIDLYNLQVFISFANTVDDFWEGPTRTISFVAAESDWSVTGGNDYIILTLNTSDQFNMTLGSLFMVSFFYGTEGAWSAFNEAATASISPLWDPLQGMDFETEEEMLFFLEFDHGFEFLLPYATPINETYYYNGVTLGLISAISLNYNSPLVSTRIFLYIDGIEFSENTWDNSISVYILSETEARFENQGRMLYLDQETGRGYFVIASEHHNVPIGQQQINWELNFSEIHIGIYEEQIRADVDLYAILANHSPRFTTSAQAWWFGGGVWDLQDTESGELSFLTDPTYFQEQGILEPFQLDISLPGNITLTNIAFENDVLRIQYSQDGWRYHLSMGSDMYHHPTFLYGVNFGYQDLILTEEIYYLGDLSYFHEWLSGPTALEDLVIYIFYSGILNTVPFTPSLTFSTNIETPPSVFVEQISIQLPDMGAVYISNLNISSHNINFQMFHPDITATLADRSDVFDMFSFSVVLRDGTTAPIRWGSGTIMWPMAPERPHADFNFSGFGLDISNISAVIINDVEIPLIGD